MKKGYLLMLIVSVLAIVFSVQAFAQDEGNISVSVQRLDSPASLAGIIIMAVFFVVLLVVFFFLLRYTLLEQKKKKALKEKVSAMDKDEAEYYTEHIEDEKPVFSDDDNIDKYLKEDERRVINILRQRGGICSQATLRIAGNFSKATLSRLLVELEQRSVIRKEKRGKKNLVILR